VSVKFRDRVAKLIDVKTIVTFALTGAFVYLSVCEKIEPQIFMTIYTMIIGFYFGTQHEKLKKE
jgi:dihydroxyacid dehydratase/phosphogluconate dehydratase